MAIYGTWARLQCTVQSMFKMNSGDKDEPCGASRARGMFETTVDVTNASEPAHLILGAI